MDNNDKETKHTRHISRRMNLVRNGEECNFTRKCGLIEVCNWKILEPIVLGKVN